MTNFVTCTSHQISYSSSHQEEWMGHVVRVGERRDSVTYMVLVGKPKRKRPLGRPRHRWKDNSKMGIQQIGGEDADWIALVQDEDKRREHVKVVMNLWVRKIRKIS